MIRTVGISEMFISRDPLDVIVTYSLGSCLGVTLYDPVARVGGMIHAMLPESSIAPEIAVAQPCRFVDTGIPRLFKESYKLGAKKERLIVTAAGGASNKNSGDDDLFQIGRRNIVMLRKLFWKNGIILKSSDLGGHATRTVTLFMSDGHVSVISNAERNALTDALERQKAAAEMASTT
jgi:chemotaxis protein CheD